MFRFGQESKENIRQDIEQLTPANTRKSKLSVWRQFTNFCAEKSYNFDRADIPVEELALILEGYGFNMRKKNSEDYKERVIKVLWNSTAKQLQEYFFEKYNRKFNPFSDIEFLNARAAKNAKRRKLQMDPTKRKESSSALSADELRKIFELWDENTPEGLQKKFFHVAGHELAWRGNEGAAAQLEYFVEEIDNRGEPTGRIEYNPVFSKTTQGGSKKMADSKWLVPNTLNEEICPVRLFKKLTSKRGSIKTKRLFLTPNPNWKNPSSKGWYKNSPVGQNTISSWFKSAASLIGIDVKKIKITNHSVRATAVSTLAKTGIGEQQLIKITGHGSSHSIKPYLQIDSGHHQEIIDAMRSVSTSAKTIQESLNQEQATTSNQPAIVYNNCVFHINNNYNSQNNISN